MFRNICYLIFGMIAGCFCCTLNAQQKNDILSRLKTQFVNPPDSAKPGVYWYFMDGNLSAAGITKAMKIMNSFGAGGSFTEYYAMDYTDDVVLMGHDGPGHIAIAEGKTKVRPLLVYHGKTGRGLSVEMSVQNGPVTLLSVVETGKGTLTLLVAEGASVSGPILKIGNTNSRYKFSIGARNFVNAWNGQGPAHHCAVGVGHIASKIEKLGKLLNIDVIKIPSSS